MTDSKRQEAIKIIKSECYISDLLDLDRTRMVNSALDAAIEALMAEGEIYDIDYSPWIPVSERLPEEGGDYLVTIKWKGSYSGDVYIETNMAVYREKSKKWDCVGVIAWKPMPEPYKAESEE